VALDGDCDVIEVNGLRGHPMMLAAPSLGSQAMRVVGFDHAVLAVSDVDRSLSWYMGILGLEGVRVEEWRRNEVPFPSVRVSRETIIDLIPRGEDRGGRNLDHLCLVVEPTDLVAWAGESGLKILDGPDHRFGAKGVATSIYIHDPDGNTVELRYY
jgi:catechol 2,3-dioxygenase-like lactoylglutathione lyase family enzyme